MKLVGARFCSYLNQDRTAQIVFSIPRVGLHRDFLYRLGNGSEDDIAVLDGASDVQAIHHHQVSRVAAPVRTDLRGLGAEVIGETAWSLTRAARTRSYNARCNR